MPAKSTPFQLPVLSKLRSKPLEAQSIRLWLPVAGQVEETYWTLYMNPARVQYYSIQHYNLDTIRPEDRERMERARQKNLYVPAAHIGLEMHAGTGRVLNEYMGAKLGEKKVRDIWKGKLAKAGMSAHVSPIMRAIVPGDEVVTALLETDDPTLNDKNRKAILHAAKLMLEKAGAPEWVTHDPEGVLWLSEPEAMKHIMKRAHKLSRLNAMTRQVKRETTMTWCLNEQGDMEEGPPAVGKPGSVTPLKCRTPKHQYAVQFHTHPSHAHAHPSASDLKYGAAWADKAGAIECMIASHTDDMVCFFLPPGKTSWAQTHIQSGPVLPSAREMTGASSAICTGNLLSKKWKCYISDEERTEIANKLTDRQEQESAWDKREHPYTPGTQADYSAPKRKINPCSEVKRRERLWHWGYLPRTVWNPPGPVVFNAKGNRILVEAQRRISHANLNMTAARAFSPSYRADYACIIGYREHPDTGYVGYVGHVKCIDRKTFIAPPATQGGVTVVCQTSVAEAIPPQLYLPDCGKIRDLIILARQQQAKKPGKYKDFYHYFVESARRSIAASKSGPYYRIPTRKEYLTLKDYCMLGGAG